jgi:pyrroline-5-carboxylate reductase
MFTNKKIAFIGAGNMGEILIKGLLKSGKVAPAQIVAAERVSKRREIIEETYKVSVTDDAVAIVKDADVVVLAVKPQNISPVLDSMQEVITEDHLLISIAAGIHTDTIASHFPRMETRIIRVMPNAPALVLAGASALYQGRHATDDDMVLARGIFDQVGVTVVVEKERFIDIVTGLSGSGPAYLFMIIEALSDAGVQQGLSRKVANRLAAQTVYGAGKMFLDTNLHAGVLKDLVATPGGTTFAGLRALENGNFRAVIMDAVEAATKKSEELGKR